MRALTLRVTLTVGGLCFRSLVRLLLRVVLLSQLPLPLPLLARLLLRGHVRVLLLLSVPLRVLLRLRMHLLLLGLLLPGPPLLCPLPQL